MQIASRHVPSDSNRKIAFHGISLCLKGFAIMAGGENYLRTCYRDLANMTDNDELGSISRGQSSEILRNLRPTSHRSMALRAYLKELVGQLAECCPVTGKKIITVSQSSDTLRISFEIIDLILIQGVTFQTIFSMYLTDIDFFGDEIVYSEYSVRRAWEDVKESEEVSLRDNPPLGKCHVCISLRTKMLTVSLNDYST